MCAYVNIKQQNEFLNKHRNHKTVTVYKVLVNNNGILISPYYYTQYLPGWIKSNSRAKLQSKDLREINKGIHVFINKKSAELLASYGRVYVKMTANLEDLICVGDNDAVFKKVYLSQKEYERAVEENKS